MKLGQHKFGRKPSSPEKLRRRLMFKDYLGLALPAPPPRVDWSRGFNFNWGMALNGPNNFGNGVPSDGLGDCTEAKKVHFTQAWTLCNGRFITPPDSVVLTAYEADGGYVVGDASTDQGEDMLTNLNDWRKNGFGGIALDAFTSVDPTNWLHIQQAIYLFGGVDMGFNVPQSAIDQNLAGEPWSVVPGTAMTGEGHDVCVLMYDTPSEMLKCKTWGFDQFMTLEFLMTYCTELYALLSPVWTARNGIDPSGFNLAALEADLAVVTA